MRIRAASQLRLVGWGVPEELDPPAEWPRSPRPVKGATAWSSPFFSPGPLPVAWPHGQEGKALSVPAHYLSVHPLRGGRSAHLVAGGQGSLPLGSPPASFTPDVPLTHPAPHGSDSAAPPDVRFPASVPAKEGVGDLSFCFSPSPSLGLLLQSIPLPSRPILCPPDTYCQGTRGRKQ